VSKRVSRPLTTHLASLNSMCDAEVPSGVKMSRYTHQAKVDSVRENEKRSVCLAVRRSMRQQEPYSRREVDATYARHIVKLTGQKILYFSSGLFAWGQEARSSFRSLAFRAEARLEA